MRTLAVIPVYNCEKKVGGLLRELKKNRLNILVVDDGSSDGTAGIAEAERNVTVIRNDRNLGKGAALRKGFDYALRKKYGLVIMLDGDGQHNPGEIGKFLKAAKRSDFVIGNRMTNPERMPIVRKLVNMFDSFMISKIAGADVLDVHCGYRVIKSGLLEKMKLRSDRFEIEAEMVIKAARMGARITNVNIETIYKDHRSSIRPLVDAYRLVLMLARNI